MVERCLVESDILRAVIQEVAAEELENSWLKSYYRSASTTSLKDVPETLEITVTNMLFLRRS